MATELDNEFGPLAVELIAEFGKTVTWSKFGSTGTPSTGQVSRVETTHSVKCTPPQQFDPSTGRTGQQYNAGSLTTTGYAAVTLAAEGLAFTPEAGDRVTIDGAKWDVVAVQRTYSGDNVAAYTAQIRR